jgi:hypothetical protein
MGKTGKKKFVMPKLMTKMDRRKFRKGLLTSKGAQVASVTSENWLAAFKLIDEGNKIAEVARGLKVARSTLSMRYNNKDSSVTSLGKPIVISAAIEKKLVEHVLHVSDAGYSYTKSDFQTFARMIAKEAGIPVEIFNAGDDWYYAFISRNPTLANRSSKKMNGARASGFNRPLIIKWFAATKLIFAQYTPEQIFNLDDKHLNSEEMLAKKVSVRRACAVLVTD